MREEAGMTLKQASERSGFKISTINGLERRGEGSERLKKKLNEVYAPALRLAESVFVSTESATAQLALAEGRAEDSRDDTYQLLLEIAKLRTGIDAIESTALKLRMQRLNSKAAGTAEASQAEALDRARQELERQKAGQSARPSDSKLPPGPAAPRGSRAQSGGPKKDQ